MLATTRSWIFVCRMRTLTARCTLTPANLALPHLKVLSTRKESIRNGLTVQFRIQPTVSKPSAPTANYLEIQTSNYAATSSTSAILSTLIRVPAKQIWLSSATSVSSRKPLKTQKISTARLSRLLSSGVAQSFRCLRSTANVRGASSLHTRAKPLPGSSAHSAICTTTMA